MADDRLKDWIQRSHEISANERTIENEQKNQRAKQKRFTILFAAIAVIALVAGGILLISQRVDRSQHYQEALALQRAEQFDEAAAAFEALGDYSDSAIQVRETRYRQAKALIEQGDTEGASAVLSRIWGYKDADTLLQQAAEPEPAPAEEPAAAPEPKPVPSGVYADLSNENVQVIPAGTDSAPVDLNSYTAPGVYTCSTAADAATLLNTPVTTSNFRLLVSRAVTKTSVLQVLFARLTNTFYTRVATAQNGALVWSPWSQVAKSGMFPFLNSDSAGRILPDQHDAFSFSFSKYDPDTSYRLVQLSKNNPSKNGDHSVWAVVLMDSEGNRYSVLNSRSEKSEFDYRSDTLCVRGRIDWSRFPAESFNYGTLSLYIDPAVFAVNEMAGRLVDESEALDLFYRQDFALGGLISADGFTVSDAANYVHTESFLLPGQTVAAPEGFMFKRYYVYDRSNDYAYLGSAVIDRDSFTLPSEITLDPDTKAPPAEGSARQITCADPVYRFTVCEVSAADGQPIDRDRLFGRTGLLEEKQDPVTWLIPSDIYGVHGHPFSIYYYNILKMDSLEGYHIYINGLAAEQWTHMQNMGNRLRFACDEPEGAAEYTFSICLRSGSEETISKRTVTVHILEENIPQIKALFLGDSFIDRGTLLAELKHMMGDRLTLYGIRGFEEKPDSTGTMQSGSDEGRASWRLKYYCEEESWTVKDLTLPNPFYNPDLPGKIKFDFSAYIGTEEKPGPGWAFRDLTDVFIYSASNDPGGSAEAYMTYYQAITDSIRAFNPAIRIHAMMPITIIGDGYGWGSISKNGAEEYRYRVMAFGQGLMDRYGGQDGFSVIPTHINLDKDYNIDRQSIPVNDRTPIEVEVFSDNVHPNIYGFWCMADIVFADIVANCQ